MIADVELLELHLEGQAGRFHALPILGRHIFGGGLALPQVYGPPTGREPGEQCAGEDDHESGVEQQSGPPAQAALGDVDDAGSREQGPQQGEPPRVVEVARAQLFTKCGGSHDGHHHDIQRESYFLDH